METVQVAEGNDLEDKRVLSVAQGIERHAYGVVLGVVELSSQILHPQAAASVVQGHERHVEVAIVIGDAHLGRESCRSSKSGSTCRKRVAPLATVPDLL